jgi:uncharacterized membrane protein YfcA
MMNWHHFLPGAVFLVTFAASLLSGIAGGGGGFIITPFYIAIGLTPQQAIATSKFSAFGLGAGAVAAFRERMWSNKKFSLLIMAISTAVGLISAKLITHIKNENLQLLMGILILAMIPFMLIHHRNLKKSEPHPVLRTLGFIALIFILFLQGVFSGGVGSLVSVVFIVFFGATALEANVLKRKASILLNLVIVAALLGSGLINFGLGIAGMAGGLVGGYVGSRIAVKEGETFAQYTLLGFMLLSGSWLVLTAN